MNNYEPQNPSRDDAAPRSGSAEAGPQQIVTADTTELIRKAFASVRTDNQGWAYIPVLDSKLRSVDAGFRPSNSGFKTLPDLLAACDAVETRCDESGAFLARLRVTSISESRVLTPTGLSTTFQASDSCERRGTNQMRDSGRGQSSEHVRPTHRPIVAPVGRLNADQLASRPPKLTEWAFFPPGRTQENIQYRPSLPVGFIPGWIEAIQYLRGKTLKEPWEFGGVELSANPSPILQNYLWYTFFRLCKERKIKQTEQFAAFNTGLVDDHYEQIYALFEANRTPDRQPWVLQDFCTHGERGVGEKLVRSFRPLPEPPDYFEKPQSMFYDLSADTPLLKDHLIEDNVARFPFAFIRDNCPKGFDPRDCSNMSKYEQEAYSDGFKTAILNDHQKYRAMVSVLEASVDTALKRVRWNFKTAIPQYFPRRNEMSLLLPLAIVSDEVTDVAIVVEKVESGNYLGHTILPLDMAYNNARLVCRPNSDWLDPKEIKQGEDEELEEQSGGGAATSGAELEETV